MRRVGIDRLTPSRLRVYLRAEQAFGLSSLPVRLPVAGDQLAPPPAQAPPTPPARAAAAARPSQPAAQPAPTPAAVELFVSPDAAPFDAPALTRDQKISALQELDRQRVSVCTRCRLSQTRTHTVFGEGDVDASIFFIGEGPGESEDLSGRPFVGRAGQKLDEMISAMGLRRNQVYIGNIVKCRPPGNRVPGPDEVQACTPYLVRQLGIIRPTVIVTLGLPATKFMLNVNLPIGRLRGQWHSWRGIKLMPTYHPSYVLRNYTIETRKAVWSDLQQVMTALGLESPRNK